MRKKILLLLLTLYIFVSCDQFGTSVNRTPVNVILGDASFLLAHGRFPDELTNEEERVKSHLMFVEEQLRRSSPSDLSARQRTNRSKMLDLLHSYWNKGEFPKNDGHPDPRRPCFIDKEGNICAVGFLIQETMGRELAEEINRDYKYSYISEIDEPILAEWAKENGLSLMECAMIQPAYSGMGNSDDNYIPTGLALSTALLSGTNIALSTIGGIERCKGNPNRGAPTVGIFSGTSQMVLGVLSYPAGYADFNGNYMINESQQVLSMVNIGVGLGTIILSSYYLLAKKKPKPSATAWNIYGFPSPGNQVGFGLSLRTKILDH